MIKEEVMTTAPVSPTPNRTPWIIVGVLGCMVICLLVALVAVGGYFFIAPQSSSFLVTMTTPTAPRVAIGVVNPTATTISFPTPSTLPTLALASPTLLVEPTLMPTAQVTVTVPLPQATRPPASPTAAAPKGRIAFSKTEGDRPEDKYIWIMNADGSGAKKILDRASSPSFSPDGTKLAYFHWTDGIYVANADGTDLPGKKVLGDTFTRFLDWSHDGRWIAFTAQPGGTGNAVIDIAPPDGTALKDPNARRNVAIGLSPSWSPDDAQVVFATCREGCGIFRGKSGGGDAVAIVTDDGGLPSWSPDSKRIVYQKEVDGQKQLFLINPDGTGKKQLTLGATMHVAAVWSADGNYIFYRSPEGGNWGIWRMKADGTNPVKLIDGVPPVDWAYERLAITRQVPP
jgi:Tol biopolymer transport system component